LAGLRSFDEYITDEIIAQKRTLADQFRTDPELFSRVQSDAEEKLAAIPIMSKGVRAQAGGLNKWAWLFAGLGMLGLIALRRRNSLSGKTR
jgi:hypothetical protein